MTLSWHLRSYLFAFVLPGVLASIAILAGEGEKQYDEAQVGHL